MLNGNRPLQVNWNEILVELCVSELSVLKISTSVLIKVCTY